MTGPEASTTTEARSFVGGSWRGDGAAEPLVNPANLDEHIGVLHLAGATLAREAMDAAAEAFPMWRDTPLETRCDVLDQVMDAIDRHADALAATITRENGKTMTEARAEVAGTLGDARHQLQLARRCAPRREEAMEVRLAPVGVFALITPWNFPLSTVSRKLVPALALGNTVVAKASEVTPLSAAALLRCLEEAGVPPGVANLVLAEGPIVGPALMGHGSLRGLSFTGSTATGRHLAAAVADRPVRLQLEMGGKNALVVLSDADLDTAAEAAAFAGFSVAGQWCTSTSRVIAETAIYDALLDRLRTHASAVRIGNGTRDGVTMGPLVSATHRAKVAAAIAGARDDGARLVCGGGLPEQVDGARGHWVEPTVFADVDPATALAREEIFGPVLAVLRARDAEEALCLANGTAYGLSFSIFTEDAERAEWFTDHVEAGQCHVNLPTPFRDPSMPLSGWRASGWGPPECGTFARDFYTKPKAIYRRTD